MKTSKNSVFILMSFLAGLFLSCSKEEYTYTYQGDTYVQFTEAAGTFFVLEDTTVHFDIPLQLIGYAAPEAITMPITFADSLLMNGRWVKASLMPGQKGLVPLSTTATIAAGKYTGSLQIKCDYSQLEFGRVDTLLLVLDDGTVQADTYHRTYLLKVQKYYPFVAEEFVGHYSGTYTGWNMNWAIVPTAAGLDIALGEAENTLMITHGFYQEQLDAWGEIWQDNDPQPITLKMNTSDPSNFVVEIVGPRYMGTTTTPGGDGPFEYWIGPHTSPGSFNAATKELHIKFYTYYEGPTVLNDVGEYTISLSDAH